MAQVADQLAAAVDAQWNAEAVIRRLNDPYPLPVSGGSGCIPVRLLGFPSETGETSRRRVTFAACCPIYLGGLRRDDLAGEDTELVKVLARVPTGRLGGAR